MANKMDKISRAFQFSLNTVRISKSHFHQQQKKSIFNNDVDRWRLCRIQRDIDLLTYRIKKISLIHHLTILTNIHCFWIFCSYQFRFVVFMIIIIHMKNEVMLANKIIIIEPKRFSNLCCCCCCCICLIFLSNPAYCDLGLSC